MHSPDTVVPPRIVLENTAKLKEILGDKESADEYYGSDYVEVDANGVGCRVAKEWGLLGRIQPPTRMAEKTNSGIAGAQCSVNGVSTDGMRRTTTLGYPAAGSMNGIETRTSPAAPACSRVQGSNRTSLASDDDDRTSSAASDDDGRGLSGHPGDLPCDLASDLHTEAEKEWDVAFKGMRTSYETELEQHPSFYNGRFQVPGPRDGRRVNGKQLPPEPLKLAVNAQVMLVRNTDLTKAEGVGSLVNGSIGKVIAMLSADALVQWLSIRIARCDARQQQLAGDRTTVWPAGDSAVDAAWGAETTPARRASGSTAELRQYIRDKVSAAVPRNSLGGTGTVCAELNDYGDDDSYDSETNGGHQARDGRLKTDEELARLAGLRAALLDQRHRLVAFLAADHHHKVKTSCFIGR